MMWKAELLIVKGEWDMKKGINVVLSCLTCIGLLVCSGLPVQAMGPDTCTHPYFTDSVEFVETGAYDYRADGHYEEYARIKTCLNCRYTIISETTYRFMSPHVWEVIPSNIQDVNGVTVEIFDCTIDGCPHRLCRTSGII